jgi:hypothetical protein
MPGVYIEMPMTDFFYIPSNLAFTYQNTIRRYLIISPESVLIYTKIK